MRGVYEPMQKGQDGCNSDRCHCPRCCPVDGREPFVSFVVKPYVWQHGMPSSGRSGVSYQIMEQRAVATSKCKEDADMIASALNLRKKAELLQRKVEILEAQKGVSLEMVREAFIAEATKHCRWSDSRQVIVDFYEKVGKRLKAAIE